MKSALLLSTIVAVGGAFAATGAKAQTGSYTFGTAGGGSYCDGITGGVVTSAGALSATHNYYACYGTDSYNGYFGGFGGTVKALGTGTWYQLVNSPYFSAGYQLVYDTDFGKETKKGLKKAAWVGFEISGEYGFTFEEFNSGVLLAGYDADRVNVGKHPTSRDVVSAKGLIKR
jgi:hypothetical protein